MGKETAQITRCFVVPNELGLHARAATRLTQVASQFEANVHIRLAGEDNPAANAKSVLDLLTLGAARGSRLNVIISGADAAAADQAIAELFENNLGD